MVILVKYGINSEEAKIKFNLALPGDKVVLIQNGVFWALTEKPLELKKENIEVYAIKDDFEARGYKDSESKVPLITYEEFIQLLESDNKTLG